MSKHTPGPWMVGAIKKTKQCVYVDAPFGDSSIGMESWTGLVKCYGCDDDPEWGIETAEANARLIAAAPELLEALVHLEHNARKSGADMGLALDVARAAIAKAKGEK